MENDTTPPGLIRPIRDDRTRRADHPEPGYGRMIRQEESRPNLRDTHPGMPISL
jgi:hypothetical protein